jgi:tetratricopeptide (TPR) repeat protein
VLDSQMAASRCGYLGRLALSGRRRLPLVQTPANGFFVSGRNISCVSIVCTSRAIGEATATFWQTRRNREMISLRSRLVATAIATVVCGMAAGGARAFESSSSNSTTSTSGPSAPSSYDAALAKIKRGDYAEAIPLLDQALGAEPQNADALNELGFSYRKLGRFDASLNAYQRALSINPNHVEANEYLDELYLQMKRPDLAKRQLDILDRLCSSGCPERTELAGRIQTYQG